MRTRLLNAYLPAILVVGACADDPTAAPTPPPVSVGALDVIEPGGDTGCSRGTPFRFAVLGGDPSKVVIDFAGGGACWNALTCSVAGSIFFEQAPTREQFEAYVGQDGASGMYRTDRADNPLAGWTIVHIPYCTGDIHWGDQTMTYNAETTIDHIGRRNVDAVLGWAFDNYPAATQLLISGTSAGAYGAIGYAAEIADAYPAASVAILADSGAGVLSESFLDESFPNWNAEATLPLDLPKLDGRPIADLTIGDLYIAVAQAYPRLRIAQYTTAYDMRQAFFYKAMGGQGDWSQRARGSLQAIDAETDNFSYFVAPGQFHGVAAYDHYYTQATGVPTTGYADFLADLLADGPMPAPVDCADSDDCDIDPVCDACLANAMTGAGCQFCEGWQ